MITHIRANGSFLVKSAGRSDRHTHHHHRGRVIEYASRIHVRSHKAQCRPHPCRHLAGPELHQLFAAQRSNNLGNHISGQPFFPDVVESSKRHTYRRAGVLQAILGYVAEANHRIANLDLASRSAGVKGRQHLHLCAEAQPPNSLRAVYLDRLAARLRDDLHDSQRTRAHHPAGVLAHFGAHVDTASYSLQRA